MIDSGAMGNWISPALTARLKIPRKKKERGYRLSAYDNAISKEKVTHMVTDQTLTIGEHTEQISLDVASKLKWNIILGLPWLQKHQPHIL